MIDTSKPAEKCRADLLAVLTGLTFDIAIFFEHGRDDDLGLNQNLSCPRFVIDNAGQSASWPQRWQPELPGTAPWIQSDAPWTDDIEAIADDLVEGTGLRVRELGSVQLLRLAGIRSVVAAAVFENGQIAASILVGSKTPEAFGVKERDMLRRKTVSTFMRKLLGLLKERRQLLLREMRRKFKPDLSPEKLAQDIVEMLAAANNWDYVGIFRVEDKFALVAGCDRTPGNVLKISLDYRQDLDAGMLGQTLRRRECLRADDVTVDPPPFNYKRVQGFAAKSALCYPIFVSGRIQWILDCSSTALSAFRGPDRAMLDELIAGLQSTLDLWFESRLSRAILDGLSEPVIVVDGNGKIERANSAACALFGLSKDDPSGWLLDLAADEETVAKFKPIRHLHGESVTLLTEIRQPRALLVTASLSNEAFGQYVLKFTDKGDREWLAGLEYARQTVETELGQSRALLMLAGALVERVRRDMKDPSNLALADENLARVASAIDKADFSYDRLVGALAGRSKPGAGDFVLNTIVDWALAAIPNALGSLGEKGRDVGADVEDRFAKALHTVTQEFLSSSRTLPHGVSAPTPAASAPLMREEGV